ncbi:MAG: copper homeostasis protein CutC [Acidobacteriaceae bacterium]
MQDAEKHERPVLEVIVSSLADAVESERGGADRLEVVRDLDCGGLTPDITLVRAIRRAVSLPLRVMLRENEDDSIRGDDAPLRAAALECQQIGVDGVVIGFLRNGNADLERTLEILDAVPRMKATFHHAFDETASPLNAIAHLKRCGRFDRILSSGGPGELLVRATRLELYRRNALQGIRVMAGGGLDEAAICFLRAHTRICEFHAGRAVRSPQDNNGVVQAARVEQLRQLLSEDRLSALQSDSYRGSPDE